MNVNYRKDTECAVI